MGRAGALEDDGFGQCGGCLGSRISGLCIAFFIAFSLFFSRFSWLFRGVRLIFVLLQGLSQLRRSSAEREQANALVAARLEQAYASHGQLESEFLALSRRQECSQEDLRKADSTAEALRSRCAGAQS